MISEEFPDARRGRAIAALHMVAFLGVLAAALTYAIMAESRWGWRGMYMLGIAPLVMVFFLRRGLRETARFNALERERIAAGGARPEFWTAIRKTLDAVCRALSLAPADHGRALELDWLDRRARRLLTSRSLPNAIIIGSPTRFRPR